jgi:MFS family permease
VLRALAVLYLLSAAGCGLAPGWVSLLVFRFIGGLAIGGSSVVAPMYIAEIAPAAIRGRLVALSQFNVVAGILAAYLSNYVIAATVGGPESSAWRVMLGIAAVPAALFYVFVRRIPESPRWLVKQHRPRRRRRCCGAWAATTPRPWWRRSRSRCTGDGLWRTSRSSRKYRADPARGHGGDFNQLAGINALIYYTATSSRWRERAPEGVVQSVVIGFTNLVFTMIAMTVIDRFGRKRLLLIGAAGLALCLGLVAYAFERGAGGTLVLASLIGYIAFFAFSQGSVIWVYLSEIFPNRVRARGQALGSFTHWFWAALVSWTFPVIAEASGASAFAFFAAMMVLQFVLVWAFLPETKGVSLEKIQHELGIE